MGLRTDQAYADLQCAGFKTWRASLGWREYAGWHWHRWRAFVAGATTAFVIVGFVWFASGVAYADDMTVDLGRKNAGVHMLYDDVIVKIEPAFEDYSYMMFDVCDTMGLKGDDCIIYPMNGEIGGNAIATILDGNKIIVYDRKLSPIVGPDGAQVIIAHEVGHIYCRHLGTPADPKQELEADRFAGAAMKLLKRPLEATLATLPILSERPTKSHPGRAQRIAALMEGWEHPETGKDCRK